MRRSIVTFMVLATMWGPDRALAATPTTITREHQAGVMVTIYNGNLGLVKDTREVRLDGGRLDVQFADVASQIDPTTVHLKSLTDPAGLRILEQNYEYDLRRTATLMEEYSGEEVRHDQPNGTSQLATLPSTSGPAYEIDGQAHVGTAGQVVFPALPESLVSRPTLVWRLDTARPALQRIEA